MHEERIGDTVVNGLLYGIVGGLVITLYLFVLGQFGGPKPQDLLISLSPSVGETALAGFVAHLAVASIYGILWGILYGWMGGRVRLPSWLLGLLYGLLLTCVVLIFRPPTQLVPSVGFVYILSAHMLYGLTLGYLQGRR
ncbi:MAG: hypothetical protein HC802_14765 [Caldilineaceae bacterium]|nr:hypothetical protein [Caldilineaceae bacterium]